MMPQTTPPRNLHPSQLGIGGLEYDARLWLGSRLGLKRPQLVWVA
jgi:hypothetical protein